MTVKRYSQFKISLFLIAIVPLSASTMFAQEADPSEPKKAEAQVVGGPAGDNSLDGERRLKFSFSGTPWKEVLYWIADESELSFNLDYTPRGTLNFVDTDRLYTPTEALDEINGQLLARGFTLVRRYKTLYIVDLESDVDRKFIWDLLNDTKINDIDKLGRFELAKVKFQLKSITTEDAEKQIENLVGPHGLAVTVPLARQVIVSETGENLRRIKSVLENVENRVGSEGLRSFRLKHATGDEVLAVAKPLLDIEMDSSAAEDGSIRISTDTKGKVVYATGSPDKVALVEQIVLRVDADAEQSGDAAALEFISHKVKREDPQVVLRILETLFSGDSRVRLQTRADSIMAYCTLEQHRVIEATISEVEQEPADIDVIPLRRVDPMLAVALIERMFGAEGEEPTDNAPIVDATFDPNQLIVNGTAAQLEQIRMLLSKMGERISPNGKVRGPVTRVLPIGEDAMPMAIERLREMWPTVGNGNRIRIIRQPERAPLIRVVPRQGEDDEEEGAKEPQDEERPIGSDDIQGLQLDSVRKASKSQDARISRTAKAATSNGRTVFVSQPVKADDSQLRDKPSKTEISAKEKQKVAAQAIPEIILTPTDDGLVIISEDAEAADRLEELLAQVMGNSTGPKYHIFHLKHVTAEEAQTLLETLFTGGPSSEGDESGGRGGAMGLFASGGGSSSIGAPKIIADKRLNRLFVEGTRAQVRNVEAYLAAIDVEDGPVEVKTNPKPTYIPVINTNAESVLDVLKSIYADRIFDANQRSRTSSRGGGFPGFGGFGRGGGETQTTATTGELSKMTLAADPTSNLIIVSAPGPLVKEVEQVVRQLDSWAEAAPSEEYTIGRLQSQSSPKSIIDMLKNAYPDIIKTDGEGLTSTSSNNSSSNNSSATSDAAAAQRRAAFFEAIRGGGRGGQTSGRGGRGGASSGGGRGGGGGGRGGQTSGRGGRGGGGR